MSKWTHNICEECWMSQYPDRDPVRLKEALVEICCYCGWPTSAGIYVRDDPAEVNCGGRHNASD